MIEDISREHHASDVKCLVENEVGRTVMSTTLNVEFPPTILKHPESLILKEETMSPFTVLLRAILSLFIFGPKTRQTSWPGTNKT